PGAEHELAAGGGLAFSLLPALLYGPDHPFGHPPTGAPATVASLTIDDVRTHHARIFGPQRSALVATGDVVLEEVIAMAQRSFSDWTAPNAVAPETIPPVAAPEGRVHVADFPGTPQTLILVGKPIFERGHPDEIPLTVANEAFGGSFSSRLNMNLREDKGYSYGAQSQVAFRRGVGAFVAYAAVQREHTGASLREIASEVRALRDSDFRVEEIDLAREGLVRSLTGEFQTSGAVAAAATGLFVYDLPLDYYVTLGPRLQAVKPTEASAAARQHLGSDTLTVLLVGDLEAIRGQLEDVGFGPIVPVEAPKPGG
ncbi:MAG: insulinase family protein, partial [Myxococcales bacterium]|nr:insulinase family protein [Myxococcales bacterium]